MQTSNPAFSDAALRNFDDASPGAGTMTVQGTVSKTALLLAILSATSLWAWSDTAEHGVSTPMIGGAAIGGFILAIITMFRPMWAGWTAPVYAALEGVFLGALSQMIEKRYYPGIALQAVGLTSGTLVVMLTLYATRVIRVTQKLAAGIVAATGAIALVYLATMVLRLFGMEVPYIHSAGKVGILFSLFVVGIAAFNLLLDFDLIERSSESGAPKAMEWYGGFALMVTLVWLYMEILNLLRKVYDNRR